MLVVLATFIIDFVLGFLAEVNYGRYVTYVLKFGSTSKHSLKVLCN
jgi:hypothetical protein